MVDEDISRRTIALSIRTGKLTARTLAWALRAAGQKIQKERQAHQTPHGRQTVRQLMKQGEATNSLPAEAPREFDRVARRCGIYQMFIHNWMNVAILFGVEAVCVALQFSAMLLVELAGEWAGSLGAFLHS